MHYTQIPCKSALNKLKRRIPYGWDLNIFRGCEHGCTYCYAMYSHDYLKDSNFFGTVYYKENLLENLEKELSSPNRNRDIVNIGGVCDSYQPLEQKLQIMPQVLKLMIKYKTPIIISSKSDLILRDYDLLDELSRITYVNIAQTITCMDESIRKKIEPGAVPSIQRFNVLKQFSKTNASIGVHVMPIIPYLTDTVSNLEEIYRISSLSNASYVLPGTLYLLGKTKKYFFEFIDREYPQIKNNILEFMTDSDKKTEYKKNLYSMINTLKSKYSISSNYSRFIKEKLK